MVTRIRKRFAPPRFSDDEIKTRQAAILNAVLISTMTLSLAGGLFSLSSIDLFSPATIFLTSFFVFTPTIFWFLNRRGHTKAAGQGLISLLWILITISTVMMGGIRGPAFAAFVVLILLTGILFRGRDIIAICAVVFLTALLIFIADSQNQLPQSFALTTLDSIWVTEILIFAAAAFIIYSSNIYHTRDFNRLLQAQNDLKKYQEALEERIQERTAELQISEEKLRSTLATLSDLVFVFDNDGVFTEFYQPENREDLYLPPAIFLGQHFRAVLPPELAENFSEQIDRTRETKEIQEFSYNMPIGEKLLSFNARLAPRFNAQKELSGITMVSRDVTDKIKSERNLRYQATVLEYISEAVFGTDKDFKINSWNPAAEEMYGYSAEEVMGQDIFGLMQTEYVGTTRTEAVKQLLNQGEWSGEVIQQTKDGQKINVLASVASIISSNEENLGIVGVNRDINKLKAFEQELVNAKEAAEEANRVKSQFLANISHEIRTPMTAIIGLSELLTKTKLTPKQREYISILQNSGETLLSIINGILDYSKIESNNLILELRPFILKDCINAAFNMVSSFITDKNLVVSSVTDASVPPVIVGDEIRLRQILINLLTNAIKFTNEGEIHLKVSATREENEAQLLKLNFALYDTGIGMEAEHIENLFTPFYQIESSSNRRFQGTGLGLTICKNLVEMMGGTIWVESEPELGSTFYFTIFVGQGSIQDVVPPEPVEALTRIAPAPATEQPQSILVVEDNLVNKQIALDILEQFGYTADAVENGEDALTALSKKSYDVILMDLQMPIMDGFETTYRIRQEIPANQQPYIVAVTASTSSDLIEKCLEAGMNDHLGKPYRARDLIAVLTGRRSIDTPVLHENSYTLIDPFSSDVISSSAFELLREFVSPATLPLLIDGFIKDAKTLIDAIETASREGDTVELHRQAHSLVSTAGQFGAERLGNIAREIERQAARKQLPGADHLVSALHIEFQPVKEALEEYNGSLRNNKS